MHYRNSFHIEPLFINIPLEETINICVYKLFENYTKVNNLTKASFRSLLELVTLDSFFIFDGKYYKQKDGVAMHSLLGSTLANVFLCHFEEQLMSDCPIDYKLLSYRRYVDDTFLLFLSELHVTKFLNYMNSKHHNIKFTVEREENNSLAFLDIKIIHDSGKFQTSIYRKSTFSAVLINFESFLPTSCKYNLVSTLLHRGFMICCPYKTLHFEVLKLKQIFRSNGYPQNFVDRCIKMYLDKVFIKHPSICVVPNKGISLCFSILGNNSLEIKRQLQNATERTSPYCQLNVIFKSPSKIVNRFHFKDVLPKKLCSGIVYSFKCNSRNAIYYGKTKRHFYIRAAKHMEISHLTKKYLKNFKRSAISDHMLTCVCNINFHNFTILSKDSNNMNLLIKESLVNPF